MVDPPWSGVHPTRRSRSRPPPVEKQDQEIRACISPWGGLHTGRVRRLAGDRRLLPGHAPEHQDAAALPPRRPARAGRCGPGHRSPPLHHRPDRDRAGHPPVPGRWTCRWRRSSAVIEAPDLATRNELISGHLSRLEATWPGRRKRPRRCGTCSQPPADCAPVGHRAPPSAATPAVAVREVSTSRTPPRGSRARSASCSHVAAQSSHRRVRRRDLRQRPVHPRTRRSDHLPPLRGADPAHRASRPAHRPRGRARRHHPPRSAHAISIAPTGSLGAYVAEHALGVEGPVREFYLVGSHDTADQTLVAHRDRLADLPHRPGHFITTMIR
jgi:hypothetical protein